MQRRDYYDIALMIFFIVIIGFLWLTYQKIKTEGAKCIMNPMVYGARSLSQANNANLTCSCSFNRRSSFGIPDTTVILINKDNLTVQR